MLKYYSLTIGSVFAILSLVLAFVLHEDFIASFSEPIDIYENSPKNYDNVKAINTDLCVIYDIFCEEEITRKSDSGAVTGRSYNYYYVIPVPTTTEDVYYVGLKIDSEKSQPYDELMNLTYESLMSGEYISEDAYIPFEGTLSKMEDDAYKYFTEWFEEVQYFENEEDVDKYVLPLILEPCKFDSVRMIAYADILAFIVGVLLLIFGLKKPKNEARPSLFPFIIINGVNYPSSNLEKVNLLVHKGKKDKAIKELMDVTNIDLATATDAVNRWNEIW